jgi:hypothetical protein
VSSGVSVARWHCRIFACGLAFCARCVCSAVCAKRPQPVHQRGVLNAMCGLCSPKRHELPAAREAPSYWLLGSLHELCEAKCLSELAPQGGASFFGGARTTNTQHPTAAAPTHLRHFPFLRVADVSTRGFRFSSWQRQLGHLRVAASCEARGERRQATGDGIPDFCRAHAQLRTATAQQQPTPRPSPPPPRSPEPRA